MTSNAQLVSSLVHDDDDNGEDDGSVDDVGYDNDDDNNGGYDDGDQISPNRRLFATICSKC